MNPRPGEIWLIYLGFAAKTRQVVVVSRFDPDVRRALVTYVPLTTQNSGSCYGVPHPKFSFERKMGKLPETTFTEVRKALSFALNLEGAN